MCANGSGEEMSAQHLGSAVIDEKGYFQRSERVGDGQGANSPAHLNSSKRLSNRPKPFQPVGSFRQSVV